MAWKTVKDYLEETGAMISPATSKQVIKDAVEAIASRYLPAMISLRKFLLDESGK